MARLRDEPDSLDALVAATAESLGIDAAAAVHHRVDDFGPVTRRRMVSNVATADMPMLLVHGLVENRSVFPVLRRALRRRGFGNVLTRNIATHHGRILSTDGATGRRSWR